MKRKRFIKLMMGAGISRNEAEIFANGCHGQFSHLEMLFCVAVSPELRTIVREGLPALLQGASFSVGWARR